jgi:hypothetical protein
MEHLFVEFRAGKLKLEGNKLLPDPRKGLVRLVKVCTGWRRDLGRGGQILGAVHLLPVPSLMGLLDSASSKGLSARKPLQDVGTAMHVGC